LLYQGTPLGIFSEAIDKQLRLQSESSSHEFSNIYCESLGAWNNHTTDTENIYSDTSTTDHNNMSQKQHDSNHPTLETSLVSLNEDPNCTDNIYSDINEITIHKLQSTEYPSSGDVSNNNINVKETTDCHYTTNFQLNPLHPIHKSTLGLQRVRPNPMPRSIFNVCSAKELASNKVSPIGTCKEFFQVNKFSCVDESFSIYQLFVFTDANIS